MLGGLSQTIHIEKRFKDKTTLLIPAPDNGTCITRRADPCKTYSTTRPIANAKAPVHGGPIGPVGFMRLLGGFQTGSEFDLCNGATSVISTSRLSQFATSMNAKSYSFGDEQGSSVAWAG